MLDRSTGLLRCPTLIARSDQQHTLDVALDRLAAGHGSGVVVVGEAGVGKSRLVEWLRDNCADRGVPMLIGRASDAGTPTALAPIQEALVGCAGLLAADLAGRIGDVAPLLAHLVPIPGQTLSAETTPVLLGHAVLSTLGTVAPGSVLVIEDVHATDADTIAVLRHLLTHAPSKPVLVIATSRPEGPGRDFVTAARGAGASVLALDRLSDTEVGAVVGAMLGTEDPPAGLADHLQLAEGLPLLVEDLLADALARGNLEATTDGWTFAQGAEGTSGRFEDVVQRRLGELSPEAGAVVSAAAVLGPALVMNVLPDASGIDPSALGAAVREAASAQLLTDDGSRFRHALTREVALAWTPAFERAAIARRLAPLLEDPPDSLLAACGELLVQAASYDAAARLFLRSALVERRTGAADTAALRLERACDVVRDPELEAEIVQTAIGTLIDLGRLTDARSVAAAHEPKLGRDDRIDLWLTIASGAAATADAELLESNLAAATALMDAQDPRRPRALVLESLRTLQFADDIDRRDQAEGMALHAAAEAAEVGDHEAAADAWMIVGRCARFRDLDEAASAYERAHTISLAHSLDRHHLQALHELGALDMLRNGGRRRLELARDMAVESGALTTLASILLNLSGVHLMAGEWEQARAYADEAALLGSQIDFPLVEVMGKIWRACAIGSDGDVVGGRQLLDEAAAAMPHDPGVQHAVDIIVRLPLAICCEDRAEALRLVSEQRPQAEYMSYEQGWLLLFAAMQGTLDAAAVEAALGDALHRVRPVNMRAIETAALVVALGREDPVAAEAMMDKLVPDVAWNPFFQACAVRYVGEAALHDGWGRPGEWLQIAHDWAVRHGHPPMIDATRDLLAAAGVRVARPTGASAEIPDELRRADVTPREWEVLRHLHDQPTNAELAERLFVSVRTMEKHVSSLLAKLHVTSRRDLARLAADRGWTTHTH